MPGFEDAGSAGGCRQLIMNIPLSMRDIHGALFNLFNSLLPPQIPLYSVSLHFAFTKVAKGITTTFFPSEYVLSPGYKT